MRAKHRKQSFTQRRLNTALIAGAAAVIGAGGYTAIDAATNTDRQPVGQPSVEGGATSNQTGRVLAVSDTSMTAQSPDGIVRTYELTPATAKITDDGAGTGSAPDQFAVNQVVTIVATVDQGTATATAVADQRVASGQGAPMDWPSPNSSTT